MDQGAAGSSGMNRNNYHPLRPADCNESDDEVQVISTTYNGATTTQNEATTTYNEATTTPNCVNDDDDEVQVLSPTYNRAQTKTPEDHHHHDDDDDLQVVSSTINQATPINDGVSLDCLAMEFGRHRFRPVQSQPMKIGSERIQFGITILSDPSVFVSYNIPRDAVLIIQMEVVRTVCHCTIYFHNYMSVMMMQQLLKHHPNDIYDTAMTGAFVNRVTFVLRKVFNHEETAKLISLFGQRFITSRLYDLQFMNAESLPKYKDDDIIIAAQRGGYTVTVRDYKCLDVGAYLNDIIIDFYLKYLHDEVLSMEDRQRVHVLSSYFYKCLTSSHRNGVLETSRDRHHRVRRWTKNVNIFMKDFVIIPINLRHHWFVVIVCFPGLPLICPSPRDFWNEAVNNPDKYYVFPCILIFDSMPRDRTDVFVNIMSYLSHEYESKTGQLFEFSMDNMLLDTVHVPRQINAWSCGVFALQYVEHFFKYPIQSFMVPIRGLEAWFNYETIIEKRVFIINLIKERKTNNQVVLPELLEPGERLFADNFLFD